MATQDPPPRVWREPTMHTGGTFPRDKTSALAFLGPLIALAGVITALCLARLVLLAPKSPGPTPEQVQQEQLRYRYEEGQRMQSYLRGVIGAPPIHQHPKPERQP
jgi:hypothetical protein